MIAQAAATDRRPASGIATATARRNPAGPGLLTLQRTAGNRAVTALLGPHGSRPAAVQRCGPVPPERCGCHGDPAKDDIADQQAGQQTTIQGSWLDDVGDAANAAWDSARATGSRAGQAVGGAWDSAKGLAAGAATAVGDAASSAWEAGSTAVDDAAGWASSGVAAAGRSASGVVGSVAAVAQGTLLRPGTTGGAVATVQQLLSAVVPGAPHSGVFDAGTAAAVRAFQAARGLAVDGIVGPRTLQALTSGATLLGEVRSSVPSFGPDQVAILRGLHARPGALTATVAGAGPGPLLPTGGGGRPAGGAQRSACAYQPCPPGEEVPATPDISASAERCIQAHYRAEHPGSTVSSNREYLSLTGRDPREKDALDCLRRHFTAKSGTHPGEPDIWDFTNNTMYEVTTRSGAAFRKGKLAAELLLANKIAAERECGGQLYGPGDWAPVGPCISLGGTGAFMSVRNEGGVLVYTPMRRKQQKQEQEQDLPATDKEQTERLKEKLATVALAAGIALAVLLVIVLCVIGVLTAPAWLPAVLAGLGLTAIIALVVGSHESTSSTA